MKFSKDRVRSFANQQIAILEAIDELTAECKLSDEELQPLFDHCNQIEKATRILLKVLDSLDEKKPKKRATKKNETKKAEVKERESEDAEDLDFLD